MSLAHGISQRRHRGLVTGLMDLEPHHPHAPPERLGRAEKTGGLLTVAVSGEIGKALKVVGKV